MARCRSFARPAGWPIRLPIALRRRLPRARRRASASSRTLPPLCVLRDRKSTRLNSSHSQIPYAVFCLKKNDCNQNAANPNNPMKAIVNCEYGVENLQLREIEKPTPADNEVLVRVRAASINTAHGHLIRGVWLMRPMLGMRKPKNTRFGTDFAGIVEAVGKNVADFKAGDE